MRGQELIAAGAAIAVLRASDVPIQSPPDRAPGFFARPVTHVLVAPRPQAHRWAPLLALNGNKGRIIRLKHFTLSVVGDLSTTGITFRVKRNGRVLSSVLLAAGVDLCKDGPTDFPLRWRHFPLTLLEQDTALIEYRNPLGSALPIACGFRGWEYGVQDAGEPGGNKVSRYADAE
jgi:hypothetical protein